MSDAETQKQDRPVRFLAPRCPDKASHTECPEGYIQWHAWAEKMSKTHEQERCAGCGLFTIWRPKRRATALSVKERGE